MALLGIAVKFLASLALWPLALCLAYALVRLMAVLPWGQGQLPWFLGGFGTYLVIQVFFWRPLFLYVMGHELTHALAAVIQGGQADDLRVSTKGGMVKVNKSNFIVSLAPYFFPIYTAMAAGIWAIAAPAYQPFVAAVVGLTLAFHFALTLYSLKQHQSDITDVGWLFAIPLIAGLNLIVTVLVLRLLGGPAADLGNFFNDTGSALASTAGWVRARL